MIPLILLHIALTAQLLSEKCVEAATGKAVDCLNPSGIEHIIEIRTKREEAHPQCPDSWANFAETAKACKCPTDYEVVIDGNPEGASVDCIKTTKTLWIDGQRIGVIKETEEK